MLIASAYQETQRSNRTSKIIG